MSAGWERREVTRRHFLGWAGAGTGALALAASGVSAARALATPYFHRDPFSLGVASGEPLPDGVVLWTRLAPEPLAGGGMPERKVPIRWEVAHDDGFRRVVRRGETFATPELAHSVHVEVDGLEPAREYWYRFKAGPELSPAGRTKTAPALGSSPAAVRFAFASCQNYQAGYYTAYRHMTDEDLDLVVHLGDYIYEGGVSATAIRPHDGPEPTTLAGYRNRLALYKTDEDLQAAHAAFAFVATWDDHEVENNYAGAFAQDELARPAEEESPAAFLPRRAVAYQAYYEHLPLRLFSRPSGPDMQLYRRLAYGDLAEFQVLDTRQYRSNQVCDPLREPGREPPCPEQADPSRSITGDAQERWLFDGLDRSGARWNVIAQQVFVARRDFAPGPAEEYSMDAWDGYLGSQQRLLSFLAERRPSNPVVLTGDVHSNWACDLKADFDDPASPTVGSELVGTSISSGGDGVDVQPTTAGILAENPRIKFYNGQRGYVRCTLDRQRWQADFRVVPFVTQPGAPIFTRASFVIEDGHPGVQPA